MYVINYIYFLLIIFIIQGCANTRVVVEGVKTVIQKNDELSKKFTQDRPNDKKAYVKGHYKVGKPYEVNNVTHVPKLVSFYEEIGIASWYGPKFHNKLTANGEIFDQNKISAAHKTLPLPSIVKVTNLNNNKYLYIRVNDRGPFINNRIIDLSKQAAIELNVLTKGVQNVNVKLIESGPHLLEKNFLNQAYLEKYSKKIEEKRSKEEKKNKLTSYLQLGVFSIKKNAQIFSEKLTKDYQGKSQTILIKEKISGKNLFKVLLGPFINTQNAKNVADNLLELGYNSFVITLKE